MAVACLRNHRPAEKHGFLPGCASIGGPVLSHAGEVLFAPSLHAICHIETGKRVCLPCLVLNDLAGDFGVLTGVCFTEAAGLGLPDG